MGSEGRKGTIGQEGRTEQRRATREEQMKVGEDEW